MPPPRPRPTVPLQSALPERWICNNGVARLRLTRGPVHRLLQHGADLISRLTSVGRRSNWLSAATPTADIYFLNAMEGFFSRSGGLQAVGPNVYRCHDRFVVLRYANDAELSFLESARRQAVYYVLDDDIEALAVAPELPAGYRRRLAGFAATSLPRILRISDVIVAPNELLLERFKDHATALLEPSYCALCDDFSHFEDRRRLRIVFTGTRSHVNDVEAIAPALVGLCDAHPQVELTTFLGRSAPAALRRHQNIIHRETLGWPAYRELLASARFHLGLAPFRPVPTNERRSHNKIHDHAAFGAAGLYGDIHPYRRTVSHGRNGLLLATRADLWLQSLSALIADPALARQLAERGAQLSRTIGSPAKLREFWCEALGLPKT